MGNQEKQLFLLDGMALVYRAFYALYKNPRLTASGFNTSAIFGYITTLVHIIETRRPDFLAVAFDTPEPTKRHVEFPDYKAQREKMPEDLSAAIPHIYRVTQAFNIPALTAPGYEADDIIGTLADRADTSGMATYMVTPDKDFAQLVTDKVLLYKPARFGNDVEILGVPEVLKKWGIAEVSQVVDMLGLWGDASDNIPGIPGIGEKTARKLIADFGSIENLIQNATSLKGKQRERVEEFGEQALLSKRLATIDRQVPNLPDIASLEVQPWNVDALRELFDEFEFRTLTKRLLANDPAPVAKQDDDNRQPSLFSTFGSDDTPTPSTDPESIREVYTTSADVPHVYRKVATANERAMLLETLATQPFFCFDTETTGLDPMTTELVGIAFSIEAHAGYYVVFPDDTDECKTILDTFRPLFGRTDILKIGHNLKFDISVLHWHGLDVAGPFFDTMLAHYLIDPESRHKLDILARNYLGYTPVPIEDLIGPKGADQKSMRDVSTDLVTEYAVEDTDVTLQLKEIFAPLLKEHEAECLFHDIESPLISVLIAMEAEGVALDKAALSDYSAALEDEIGRLAERIHHAADLDFNIDSPKQLGDVLFDHLQLEKKAKKTGKTGQYSTSEQVLSRLAGRHEIVRDVLAYRTSRKLKSTYVDALPAAISPRTGRIHTTFNQAVTATGRLQSQGPNLQNIPIKTEKGREIRKAFIPRDDAYRILSADYSQIELRIIASLSDDPAMLDAFRRELDIHQSTAANIFDVALDDVTPDMRRKAKMVNFGIIYGISAFGLSQRLGIPRKEANFIIDQYFARYSGVKRYIDTTIQEAHDLGYVETMCRRRRYLRDINSANHTIRAAAERTAINAPIQGTAADMIKIAMVTIHKNLREGALQTRMIIQVHDELVFDMHRDERTTVIPMIKSAMESAITMNVPVIAEVGMGRNWLEAH